MSQVLNLRNKSLSSNKMFFDDSGRVGIVRHDQVKYPIFVKLAEQARGFMWRETEIECQKDARDFRQLTEHEQHIFTSNLKRQIVLDSVQGRAPGDVFGPIVGLSEVEDFIGEWEYFERIHSRSYTHIIRGVYSRPEDVLDSIFDNEQVVACAKSISKYYDSLDRLNKEADIYGYNVMNIPRVDLLQHKKALWLCLNAVNALEGIRFYVSFACSWAFAELKKMEGNAKIIKLIARDENIHLAATQHMLKLLPKDDPDFAAIKEECAQEVQQLFQDVIDQEIEWARYLFQGGSMIGLNEALLTDYIYEIAGKRLRNIGIKPWFTVPRGTLPWTAKWIGGKESASIQNAPQETEIESYIVAGTKKDITSDTFKGFEL
jgi:ribonucleoside-diphosphate reductase beta chain